MTTYDVVRNNWQALRGDFHGRDGFGDTSDDITTWDYMVLDEVWLTSGHVCIPTLESLYSYISKKISLIYVTGALD
jgi:hypothetical protein